MILIEFPLAAFLKGSLLVACVLCLLGVTSYFKLKPFIYLKKNVSNFSLYLFGSYVAGALSAAYKYGSDFSTDYAFGIFLLINLILLPFFYKVKSAIENHLFAGK